MKFRFQGREVYIDGYLAKNLDFLKDAVRKDWDNCLLGDGMEGGGKSICFQIVAAYLDPTFCLDRIVFTPKEFETAIKKAEKYQAVLYDEAFSGLSSRGFFSEVNRSLIGMLTMIRQKNLHVLVLSPAFWELERYLTLWRSRALIHVYVGKGWERGYFSFFNYERKKSLYLLGKKTFSYCVAPDFRGRFTNTYVVNEEAYRAKKLRAMIEKGRSRPGLDKWKVQRNGLLELLVKKGLTHREIAEGAKALGIKGLSEPGIQYALARRAKEDGE